MAMLDWVWNDISEADVYQVELASNKMAEDLLTSVSALELTQDQAARLAPGAPAQRNGKRAYLVRAIRLEGCTGKFEVHWANDTLWVRYGCLTRRKTTGVKQPLVIYLKSLPLRVLVDAVTGS
jgi:hypothetical protein